MRMLALAVTAALASASFVTASVAPARANAFCPVTIAAVTNLAILGKADTYGVMLDQDPSDATVVRLRIDSTTTRYALDITDLAPATTTPLQAKRYFTLGPGEKVAAAWVESTGTSPDARLECPLTLPYASDAPPPIDPRALRDQTTASNAVRDGFSTKTPVLTATSFGPAQPLTCAQPFAPAHAMQDVKPAPPAGAKAVHANGITIVRVDLDEKSNILRTLLVRSSGFAPLDATALTAAQTATYRTQIVACRPVASSYQFTVSFAGN